MGVVVAVADAEDVRDLGAVAARTFPLACPPTTKPEDIAGFIEANLSPARFAGYLTDPDRLVLVSRQGDRIVGYAMLVRGLGDDADVRRAVTTVPTIEISKLYVLPDAHGLGVASALMDAAIEHARRLGAASVWLGVNQQNRRAQRFYAKHGFRVEGTKHFQLGAAVEDDYVLVRPL